MFITKKALSAADFLRGDGRHGCRAAVAGRDGAGALRAAAEAHAAAGFIYIANGVIQNQWNPATTGRRRSS